VNKHTPGPWKAKKWVGTDPYDDPDRPFVEVGNVHWSPKNWKPAAAIKQTANARLIAAAPNLLSALEEVFTVMNDDMPVGLRKVCYEAIAKAKGE